MQRQHALARPRGPACACFPSDRRKRIRNLDSGSWGCSDGKLETLVEPIFLHTIGIVGSVPGASEEPIHSS